jgi:hypothetical protein
MQEMTEEWVDYYMRWLDERKDCQYFYSMNLFGQPIDFLAEGHNLWAPRPSAKWLMRSIEVLPPNCWLQTDRILCETFAQKSDATLSEDVALQQAQLFLSRDPCIDTLAECIDLWRRSKSNALAVQIIKHFSDSPALPKELLYLAYHSEAAWMSDFRASLEAKRALGKEALAYD